MRPLPPAVVSCSSLHQFLSPLRLQLCLQATNAPSTGRSRIGINSLRVGFQSIVRRRREHAWGIGHHSRRQPSLQRSRRQGSRHRLHLLHCFRPSRLLRRPQLKPPAWNIRPSSASWPVAAQTTSPIRRRRTSRGANGGKSSSGSDCPDRQARAPSRRGIGRRVARLNRSADPRAPT